MRDFLVTYLSPKLKLEENTTVNLDNSNREGETTGDAFDRMVEVELEMNTLVKNAKFDNIWF